MMKTIISKRVTLVDYHFTDLSGATIWYAKDEDKMYMLIPTLLCKDGVMWEYGCREEFEMEVGTEWDVKGILLEDIAPFPIILIELIYRV